MLRLALLFLVIAMLAGAFGMWGIAGPAMEGARILFFVFIVLAVLFFASNAFRGEPRDIV